MEQLHSLVEVDPKQIMERPAITKEDSLNPIEKPEVHIKPEILTERYPYKEKNLFQQIEDEMEDMMEEMKDSIRRN